MRDCASRMRTRMALGVVGAGVRVKAIGAGCGGLLWRWGRAMWSAAALACLAVGRHRLSAGRADLFGELGVGRGFLLQRLDAPWRFDYAAGEAGLSPRREGSRAVEFGGVRVGVCVGEVRRAFAVEYAAAGWLVSPGVYAEELLRETAERRVQGFGFGRGGVVGEEFQRAAHHVGAAGRADAEEAADGQGAVVRIAAREERAHRTGIDQRDAIVQAEEFALGVGERVPAG